MLRTTLLCSEHDHEHHNLCRKLRVLGAAALMAGLMGTNWSAEAALAAGGAADDVSQLMAHSAPHDVRPRRPSEYALAVHEIKHQPS